MLRRLIILCFLQLILSISAVAQSIEKLREAADQGSVDAALHLGEMYANGGGDVKRDYPQAVEWFRKAADAGLAQAQYDLFVMYENGLGVARDSTQANEWLQKTVDKNGLYMWVPSKPW